MYAVVKTGGKQYRIAKEDTILVEKLEGATGDPITLSEVIMLGDGDKITIDKTSLKEACVKAEVIRQTRGPKILMLHRKRRKNQRRLKGHRQDLTLLKITDILTSKKAEVKAAEVKTKAAEGPKVETKAAEAPQIEVRAKTQTTKSETPALKKAKASPKKTPEKALKKTPPKKTTTAT